MNWTNILTLFLHLFKQIQHPTKHYYYFAFSQETRKLIGYKWLK